jgi:hypothetical protein
MAEILTGAKCSKNATGRRVTPQIDIERAAVMGCRSLAFV